MTGYGFTTSSKSQGQMPRNCPSCGKLTYHTIERRKGWFTFFFLPVLPAGRGQVVTRCNLCGLESFHSPGQPLTAAAESGSKTCPDCAELIQVEARLCRYCGYRFSDEEIEASRLAAREEAARLKREARRRGLLAKARVYTILGRIVTPPAALVSVLGGVLVVVAAVKNRFPANEVGGHVIGWLIVSVPAFLGLWFLKKARKLRGRAEVTEAASPAVEDPRDLFAPISPRRP